MIEIDVVVPCYNYARYLQMAVGSVLKQRDVLVRILIVDDQSPDDTPAMSQALAAAHPQVSVLRNEKNLGLVGTINRGVMEWAKAPYVLVLSADDALTPGALARAVSVFERHSDVGMVYGLARVMGVDGPTELVADTNHFSYVTVSGSDFIRDFCEHKNGVASPTVLVKTSVQHDVGGYEPRFPHTCDVEMWMRIATRAAVSVIDYPQAYYRWHAANMSAAYIKRPLNDLKEQMETSRWVHQNYGTHITEFPGWIRDMAIRFANEACWLAGRAEGIRDQDMAAYCLDFAQKMDPAIRTRPTWWKYVLKRSLVRLFPGFGQAAKAKVDFYVPFQEGKDFGRIPGGKAPLRA